MQSTHLFTLLLATLTTFTLITALPHALPNTHITHRSITFRRASIHFPSHFRSLLPSSGAQYHNLFPSHNQKSKSKSKKDQSSSATASTATTKPFSFTIWNILSHPESAFNNGTDGGEVGGKEPTAAELSIFKGGAVGGNKKRRTFGFLRSAIPWSSKEEDVKNDEVEESDEWKESMLMEQGDKTDTNAKKEKNGNDHGDEKSGKEDEMKKKWQGAWKGHGNGLKHSNKQSQPGLEAQTRPTAPLRVSMAGFKSWFDDAKEKEEGVERPPQSGLQRLFGWRKKA
ncbi:hypothetical protein BDZ45DRAFT_39323 [Acephala macrosclerotiorum]|nr:hypothetical protein BDZ45DRAFT_39323 [Acephala macrosclerotiorum]